MTPTPGTPGFVSVVGRYVLYNGSVFDGSDTSANAQDDAAIAADKAALLPGETATPANYTSYGRGVNGIMIDVDGLPVEAVLDTGDFDFRVGNDNFPETWPAPASVPEVTLRRGEGTYDSDRITLIWPDYAVTKQWLRVTLLANATTQLSGDDVFYFGNATGESGNSTSDAKVNALDMLGARDNQRNFLDPAPIDFRFDFNRDARVDVTDMLIARNNQTHFLNALKLITVPGGKAAGEQASVAGRQAAQDEVFRQAVEREPERPATASSKLDWLYEFEELSTNRWQARKASAVEETLDLLLAAPGL